MISEDIIEIQLSNLKEKTKTKLLLTLDKALLDGDTVARLEEEIERLKTLMTNSDVIFDTIKCKASVSVELLGKILHGDISKDETA